jgi:hypothetical protein
LILILYFNERSQTAQGETPWLPTVVGPHNIRSQHFLMLWWVLLCDYCSYFCHLPKTSELGRAINAHIIIAAYYRDHCLLFRVYSFAELSSAFIITTPEGAAVVYTNTFVIFFQSYINRAWGMPASFVHSCMCIYIYIYIYIYFYIYILYIYFFCTSLRFLFSPTDRSERSHYCFPLQQHSQ